jgi:hypothetical protein
MTSTSNSLTADPHPTVGTRQPVRCGCARHRQLRQRPIRANCETRWPAMWCQTDRRRPVLATRLRCRATGADGLAGTPSSQLERQGGAARPVGPCPCASRQYGCSAALMVNFSHVTPRQVGSLGIGLEHVHGAAPLSTPLFDVLFGGCNEPARVSDMCTTARGRSIASYTCRYRCRATPYRPPMVLSVK